MRWLSLVIVLALFAASCSDESASTDPDSAALAAELAAANRAEAVTTTTLRPPVPTDPPEREAATIGDLEIPCRPAEDTRIEGDHPGVTPESITIGTGSDRGGVATVGAGNGIFEMLEVLVDLCNASGGLLGRDVSLRDFDAAGEEAVERVEEACTETAALVGHSFVQFVAAEFTALACGLRTYPAGVGLQPTTPFPLHGHLAAAFTDPAAANVVLVGPDTPTGDADRSLRRAAIAQGAPLLSVVGTVTYPIDAPPDWSRIVGEARAMGAGQVQVAGGCQQAVIPFAEFAEAAGWRPVTLATVSAYDSACLDSAQADRLLIELPFLPFEDGESAPAAAEHLALLQRVGAEPTGMGVLAASAFWRWATDVPTCLGDGASDCPGSVPGAEVGWTGAGLHPAIDPTTPACAVLIGIGSAGFERRLPVEAGEYDCSPTLSVLVDSGVALDQSLAAIETDG